MVFIATRNLQFLDLVDGMIDGFYGEWRPHGRSRSGFIDFDPSITTMVLSRSPTIVHELNVKYCYYPLSMMSLATN